MAKALAKAETSKSSSSDARRFCGRAHTILLEKGILSRRFPHVHRRFIAKSSPFVIVRWSLCKGPQRGGSICDTSRTLATNPSTAFRRGISSRSCRGPEADTGAFSLEHSDGSRRRVRFSIDDANERFEPEVADDGVGIPEDRRAGVEMNSLVERAAELGDMRGHIRPRVRIAYLGRTSADRRQGGVTW